MKEVRPGPHPTPLAIVEPEQTNHAMAFEKLIDVERCQPDKGTFVACNGVELAVFVLDDASRAVVLDNSCPHASGNLSGGEVRDGVVLCPWHQWEFDLGTGVCTHSDRAVVKTYPAEIRDNEVWADLS